MPNLKRPAYPAEFQAEAVRLARSTDCRSGPREILEGGQLGRLVPMQDPQALSAAIAATLDEAHTPVLAERMQPYRQADADDSYVPLFERVLAARRTTR